MTKVENSHGYITLLHNIMLTISVLLHYDLL